MKVSRNVGEELNIMINGSRIEQVKSLKYLGRWQKWQMRN